MLSLDDPRWRELSHAYGSAEDIPLLLRQLREAPLPPASDDAWSSLWSALAHQGSVYSATFAAMPHIVDILSGIPDVADATYFQFPAWVECCRASAGGEVPEALRKDYAAALARLPFLVAEASKGPWTDEGFMPCALAAIAVAKGHPRVAMAVLELDEEVAVAFMDWFWNVHNS